jgi:hypothetical protein
VIRRLFWLGVGCAVGALVVREVTRAVHAYSPRGVAGAARESAVGWLDSLRDFMADVQDGMMEREAEIREAFAQGVTLDELADDRASTWAGADGFDLHDATWPDDGGAPRR